eukprot:3451317-Karenia_brevis.AAC.1
MAEIIHTKVLPKITDHNPVLLEVACSEPSTCPVERTYWRFARASWTSLRDSLSSVDWGAFSNGLTADHLASKLTIRILSQARRFTPRYESSSQKSSHPWLNERCFRLIEQKHAAEGTANYAAMQERCSA